MKNWLLICLLGCVQVLSAQKEATLLYHWEDNTITPTSWLNGRYNEVWGFALDGREYGVIGTTDGMRIFDVTDPSSVPAPIKILAPATGPAIVHRDMKHYKQYLYAVCDELSTSTLQIVDCSKLPTSAEVVYNSNEFVVTAHNVFIDTAQQRLYLLGAGNSTKILDISEPTKPKLMGSYPNVNFQLPYVHDAYIHNHIGIMNCGNQGLWVVDFSDPKQPLTLGTMTLYPGAGYNHSGWMSNDGRHYFLCDETHSSPVKVIDFSDFEDMKVLSSMNAASFSSQIPHNALVRENLLYVSYYYDGLQVFDVSDPFNPKRVLYYDTYDGPNQASFAGSWGVNPDLPSGNILLSDMNTGFWVFAAAEQPKDYQLRSNQHFFVICEGQTAKFNLTVGRDFDAVPMTPTFESPIGAVITYPATSFQAGDIIPVEINNLEAGIQKIECTISDGTHTGTALVHLIVKKSATAPALSVPEDGAINQPLAPFLKWEAAAGATNYLIEISTAGGADFEQNIFYTTNKTGTSFVLNGANLKPLTQYFWRVSFESVCGKASSEIHDFTTRATVAVLELSDNTLDIFPNPMADALTLQLSHPTKTEQKIELWNLQGQRVLAYILPVGGSQANLSVAELPAGQYLFSVKNDQGVVSTKLVKQ